MERHENTSEELQEALDALEEEYDVEKMTDRELQESIFVTLENIETNSTETLKILNWFKTLTIIILIINGLGLFGLILFLIQSH